MKHRETDRVHYVRFVEDEEIQVLGSVFGRLSDRQTFIMYVENLEVFARPLFLIRVKSDSHLTNLFSPILIFLIRPSNMIKAVKIENTPLDRDCMKIRTGRIAGNYRYGKIAGISIFILRHWTIQWITRGLWFSTPEDRKL